MPKKTMTFEQFMHAVNNHSKSVKKRGSIAKADYQTGLFGGGQSPAAQAAAQAAAQKAAQRAAEQAQRQADAQANQRAAQARAAQQNAPAPSSGNGAAQAAQNRATAPVAPVAPVNSGNGAAAAAQNGNTRDAGDIARDRRRAAEAAARAKAIAQAQAATRTNGSAQAAQAQATAPVYQQSSGNGTAQAAQLGATTDPAARLRADAQRGLAQRNAQPNLASAFSSWLNSAGNAIGNAFAVPRAGAASRFRPRAVVPPGTPQTAVPTEATVPTSVPTSVPTGTAVPISTVGVGASATALPTRTALPASTETNAPTETQKPAATNTPIPPPPTATPAPPTSTFSPSPTATWALGAKDSAQKKLADLVLGLGSSKNFSGDIDTIIRDMKGTVPPNPTAVTGPGGGKEYTLPFRDASGYTSDQIPPYIPLLNNADSIMIADSLKTYENQRNPGSGIITGNPGLPDVFGGLKSAAADAYSNSPSSLAEKDRPEWTTPGMQLDEKTITGIYTAAQNAANDAVNAQTLGKQEYTNSVSELAKTLEKYNNGQATKQDVVNAARFAQTSRDNKTLYDARAAALKNAETLAGKAYARIINKTDDLHLKREGYDYRYPKEATLEEPVVTNPITIGDGNSNSGDGNTTITQPTASGGKTVKTPVPTITQTPTSTPLKVSQSVLSSLSNPILTAQAEQGIRYEPDNGLAPYQQGGPGAFNPYDVGQPPPDYVQNRVMGNIVPASYRSPTPSPSPTATTQRTQTPTPATQRTASPTVSNPGMQTTPTASRTPQANVAPISGSNIAGNGRAGEAIAQSELSRAIAQLMGNQQVTQQQAASAYPQFAPKQARLSPDKKSKKLKKDIGVGTGLTAHATQPVAESPMPRVHTSYGNYKFKKPSQENRSAKYGESQQLQQPVRKQIDAMQPMQPRQTMINPMQYPPSRAPQHTLNPMPLDSNESMMFKKYMGSPTEQPVQSNDKYLPAYLQKNKKD